MLAGLPSLPRGGGLTPLLQVMTGLVLIVVALDLLLEKRSEEYPFQRAPVLGLVTAVAFVTATVVFGATDSNAFIYFQF